MPENEQPAAPAPPDTPARKCQRDIAALLRARVSVLWITTPEEQRAETAIREALAMARYDDVRYWDCWSALTDDRGRVLDATLADPRKMIREIQDNATRRAYVLRDFGDWLQPDIRRGIKSLARRLPETPLAEARCIIIISAKPAPDEISGAVSAIDWPRPDRTELSAILDAAEAAGRPVNGRRDAVLDAAAGMTAREFSDSCSRSIVTKGGIEPAEIAADKRRLINRGKGLTLSDPDPRGLAAVGGLDELKRWAAGRAAAWTSDARAYGLPPPKGCLLVGIPGTGKTLFAKAVSSAWNLPLVRMDLGAVKSKYVGESEQALRDTLAVIDSVSPAVVLIDEVEKALQGATSGSSDGGVSADALGAVLTWMQDRAGSAFVVMTSNDVSALPPELTRKGRLDEMFFLDLPGARDRAAICRAALGEHRRREQVDADAVALATAGFTGSEIAALVPEALYAAYADGRRPIATADLIAAARTIVPMSKTSAERIAALRDWARGRARYANTPEAETTGARALDLGTPQ